MKKVHLVRVVIDGESRTEYFLTKKAMNIYLNAFKQVGPPNESWIDLIVEDITGSITEDGNKLR